MPIDKEKIIQRIDYLIELAEKSSHDSRRAGEVFSGTINILESLYGPGSLKCKAYVDEYNVYIRDLKNRRGNIFGMVCSSTGSLKSIKTEIESGLVGNLELQAQGEIFGDFIKLAKESLNESKAIRRKRPRLVSLPSDIHARIHSSDQHKSRRYNSTSLLFLLINRR